MSGEHGGQDALLERIHGFIVAGERNELSEDRWNEFEALLRENDEVALIDFGLARALDGSTPSTRTGVLRGSPYYMSPEAWAGKVLDEQADIWSLGVVLFEPSVVNVSPPAEMPAPAAVPPTAAPFPLRLSARPRCHNPRAPWR